MASQIAIIRATLKYSTQEDLINGMKPLISKRGLFIHTRTTRPVGSEVRFEFTLADGSQTYSGEGVVRKEIPFVGGPSSQKSGMLIALRRINRPFKAVVDAILEDEERQSGTQNKVGRQFIVESRAGEPQGFDLFGDMDFDAGLDSLFSGIAKKPAAISGLYERPTVVSGLFERPTNGDEIMLDYQQGETNEEEKFPSTPAEELTNRMDSSRVEMRSRAVTGQYAATTAIENADREAAEYELQTEASDNADMPTVNEMQAALDMPSTDMPSDNAIDDTVELSPNADGNMFGDALDFGDSPVLEQLAEERRQLEEHRQLEEQQRQLEEQQRQLEEQRFLEEQQRQLEEQQRQLEEQRFLEEQQRQLDEQQRQLDEQRFLEEEQQNQVQMPEPQVDGLYANAAHSSSQLTFVSNANQETPSELFEALHDDILGTSSADMPVTEPMQPEQLAEPAHEPVIAPIPVHTQTEPAEKASNGLTLESLLGKPNAEAPARDAQSSTRDGLTLDAVIKRADAKKDIIMTDVSAKKPIPRRRETSPDNPHQEMPAPKKGGFLSNLFKH